MALVLVVITISILVLVILLVLVIFKVGLDDFFCFVGVDAGIETLWLEMGTVWTGCEKVDGCFSGDAGVALAGGDRIILEIVAVVVIGGSLDLVGDGIVP